jgi:hypothetical protein
MHEKNGEISSIAKSRKYSTKDLEKFTVKKLV